MDIIHIVVISSSERFQRHGLQNTEIKVTLTYFEIVYESKFLKYFNRHSASIHYDQVNSLIFIFYMKTVSCSAGEN
jgi:hypothetical protein